MITTRELLTETRRNKERFVHLYYRYQESRIIFVESYARLLHVGAPAIPLRTFVRTHAGSPRMVARPRMAGAAGVEALHCWLETLSDATVVHVEGEVDLATAPDFARAVATAFLWCSRVIVDLARVTYIDGSGLGILKRAAEANGARLAVAGAVPHVRRLFDVIELTGVVPVVASLEAGREYFRRGN
jgi:anti-anti-sigma factor